MATSRQIIIFCGLLLTANTATTLTWSDVAWGVAGVVAAPFAAPAAGIGAAGVAASSVAAKVISLAQSAVLAGVAGTATTASEKAFFDGEQEDKCG